MSTYRVYIRRPLTKAPEWDWMETVVAPNAATAIAYAYDNWVNSNPNPPAPPLEQCTTQANLRPASLAESSENLSSDPGVTPAQKAFMDAIQKKVMDTLGSKLDGAFSSVNYPSGFNYGITYGSNAYYNAATLQDIDTLLGISSSGILELTGGSFSGYYARLLPAVLFVFSDADQKTINDQDTAAEAQIATVITEFTNAGGIFTDPLPFGGRLQDIFNQLTASYGDLTKLPDSLNSLRNAIAIYKSKAAASYALHNKYYHAMDYLNAALDNVTNPSAANGGMQTNAKSYYVGYTPNKLPTANQLIGGLNTLTNQVEVDITLSNFTSSQSEIAISGESKLSIPIEDIFEINIGGSVSYNASNYTSSSSKVNISIVYQGVTFFPSTPSVLSTNNTTGWYALDILAEVVANYKKDATGYQLQGSEYNIEDVFGIGKIFSRLKTFVISQEPIIEMEFTDAKTLQIVSDLKVNASVDMKLFDIFKLGSAKAGYSIKKVDENSVAGSVIVTLGPAKVSGSVPLEQQIAYVLGGVASYPPNNV